MVVTTDSLEVPLLNILTDNGSPFDWLNVQSHRSERNLSLSASRTGCVKTIDHLLV